MKEILELRPVVGAFAQEMERQLRANDYKIGWKISSVEWLVSQLVCNLGLALREDRTQDVLRRAANVANFAMMIADNEGGLCPESS